MWYVCPRQAITREHTLLLVLWFIKDFNVLLVSLLFFSTKKKCFQKNIIYTRWIYFEGKMYLRHEPKELNVVVAYMMSRHKFYSFMW